MSEDFEKELQELKEANEALVAKITAAETEKEKLTKVIIGGSKSIPVKGTFKKGQKTYRFVDGHVNIRLANGTIIPSEKLLQLANGKSISPEDLGTYPGLKQLADENGKPSPAAKDYVNHLIDIRYGYLVTN